jgi:hypothetical protein
MPGKPPPAYRRSAPKTVSALKPDQELLVKTGLLRELSALIVQLTRIAKITADDMKRAAKAKQGVE